jgi:hypothetical protein
MAVMGIVLFVNNIVNVPIPIIQISDNLGLSKYHATRINITIHAGLSIPLIKDSCCPADKKDNSSENPYRIMIVHAERTRKK